MNNFIFENKTKVYFGKGGVKEYLGSLLGNYGETVMLAYGGGSIKRNGVYDEIMGILNAAGKRVVEFSGIMSNPTYAKVQEGAKLARENHVDSQRVLISVVGEPRTGMSGSLRFLVFYIDRGVFRMKNKISRRQFLQVTGASAAALLLASCSGNPPAV